MNVLITGVDGFVGSHLARLFLGRPDVTLYGMIRSRPPLIPLDPAIHLVEGDIADRTSIAHLLAESNPDKIFHLAGQAFVPHSVDKPYDTFRINVDGVLNLLECVRENPAYRARTGMVIVSSGEVYGEVTPAMLPVGEDAPLRPANPYAVSKACADMITRQYRASFGLDVNVARPFNHLGPGQNELFVGSAFARQIAEIKLGRREAVLSVGNLEPKRDFTDVRDVVRAYNSILDAPVREPVYNICTGRAISIRELLDRMLAISGVAVKIETDPARARRQEIPEIRGDASRLRTSTGWQPEIPIDDTLRDLLAYWEHRITAGA